MALKNRGRTLAAGLLAGVLVGGGFAMVTPAGAAVKEAASAINWKNVWQNEIKPRADKRYFTKKKANARFYTKIETTSIFESKVAHDASLLNYYTKAQSDANYYTKAQSDAKYSPALPLIRGTYDAIGTAGAAGDWVGDNLSFNVTLSAAPTPHYIAIGAAVPAGCSGTAAAPNADPGHLCLFEAQDINVASRFIFSGTGATGFASTFGASMYVSSAAAGDVFVYGTWALRPVALANPAVASKGAGTNEALPPQQRAGS